MTTDSLSGLDIENGIASMLIRLPGVREPRVLRRVSDLRRQIILIGEAAEDTMTAIDVRTMSPDLIVWLPRPVAHTFATDQLGEVVVVIGPGDVLKHDEIAKQQAARPRNIIDMQVPRFVLVLEMMHELHVVTGLPGSDRRVVIMDRLRRLETMAGPGQMVIIKTVTTRAQRSPNDQLFYEFLTPKEFAEREAAGQLVQVSTYGQTRYGIDREQALAVLQQSDGICLLLEPRVDELMQLGFPVYVTETKIPTNLHLLLSPEKDPIIN